MNVSRVFIERPIATTLLMAGITLFGVVAFRGLAVSDLPNVDFPTITVNASLPGADPATMASSVATVLERQFTTIAGVDSMTSSNGTGYTSITLQVSLDRQIDSAATDVEAAIAAATPLLPPGMPFPPSFKKQNPSDQPVLQLTLQSPTLSMSQLDDYAETIVAPRISTMEGVSQVVVQGQQKYAVRVQVDPDKLVAKRIGLNEVNSAIANWPPNLPTGALYGDKENYTVSTDASLLNAAQFADLVVNYQNGAPVKLKDVATVVDSVEDTHQAAWSYRGNGQERAIQLQVLRQPGANAIAVADTVKAAIPSLQSQIPVAARLNVRFDRARNIRESFQDIKVTLLLALVLVVGVIFLFLRNLRATIIPALALPFALLGTFAVMAALNYSLDNLSMMALILSVGFVVDDAIVMLENIVRHMEEGLSPMDAAFKGSGEIGFTILSMTISLAVVFVPILFMGGLLGRLFREFAVTITATILVSGLVSITLTPMLCSRLLKAIPESEESRLSKILDWPLKKMAGFYGRTLRVVLDHRGWMAVASALVLAATVYLFYIVPKGFIPDSDQDSLNLNLRAAQGTSFFKMAEYQKKIAEIIRKDPDVDTFLANVNSSNASQMFVALKPRKDRPLSAQQLIDKLRPQLSNFPGFQVFMNLPPSIRIGGRQSNSAYQFTLQSTDTDALYKEADVFEAAMHSIPEIADISTDLQIKNPMERIAVDRERAAKYGLNLNDIETALYSAYGPQIVSTIYMPLGQYHVLEEVKPSDQMFTDQLSKVYFKGSAGQLVPLDALAELKEDAGPQSIAHSGQLPSVTISFNVKTGVSLGTAVDKVNELAKKVLPSGITGAFSGNAQAFQSSLQDLSVLLIVAVGIVYIVLGILYESYIHPLTILSGLPSAGVGALLTLVLFHDERNIYSFVGLIMLIGIVKMNAIMQIDFALEAERKHGLSPLEAIYQGCLIRFRPIMMTTMAALFGAIPIALGMGAGGESRRPLGLAVVGGLIISQVMTLYLTPVMYTYMAGFVKTTTPSPEELEPAAQPEEHLAHQ